jgi:uncharacterized membrane protein YtjA (UPF0391 family)
MLYLSLALFIVSLVCALMGSTGSDSSSNRALFGLAAVTFVLAIVALTRGIVVARRRQSCSD